MGEVKVAIIGSSNSGKSTLVNLIPRFYDTSEGAVLVDGVSVKDYSFEHLRSRIGIVPQKAELFSGTIKDNIRFGKKDASDEDIERALKISQSYEFVSRLCGKISFRSYKKNMIKFQHIFHISKKNIRN